jgi:hypothetical protein
MALAAGLFTFGRLPLLFSLPPFVCAMTRLVPGLPPSSSTDKGPGDDEKVSLEPFNNGEPEADPDSPPNPDPATDNGGKYDPAPREPGLDPG